MSYVVVLLACLARPPGDCTNDRLELPAIRNESACVVASQFALRAWRRAHPGMKVLQARCEARSHRAAMR